MRRAVAAVGMGVWAVGVCGCALDAPGRPKEAKMTDSRAEPAPKRLVLEGVPQVRYLKDGLCPFALCLKSCTDYLGEEYSYGHVLAASGACFRMSWNHTEWDEGNMDLGRLGPEPFRRGLRGVGLRCRFLLKKTWWPGEAGDDIEVVGDGEAARAAMRREIVRSLRAGLPVLAFGVVGPPEVSLVTGYDDGGDVLIGWACMTGEHPAEKFEPDGQFRQGDWFARTQGLMLVERAAEKPDAGKVQADALAWAWEVSHLPKSPTHLFGQAAHRGWARAMLKDCDFPAEDDETLQRRRHTVWDGLIMLAERGRAAEFLEEAARRRGDAAAHLREAARLFREEGACGGDAAKALGGPHLPAGPFADPTARRAAADAVLAAAEKNAQALEHLAKALGKEPGGFAFDGKELKGLRPAYRTMTLLGCIAGCMRYLGKDVDDAWLYGITGAAFMLNIDENVDVSGPTSWDCDHFRKMAPHLGISLDSRVRALVSDADFAARQQAAARFVKEKVDAGIPCYGWDGCMEWLTVNGYSKEACLQWSHYFDGGYRTQPWLKLGREIPHVFEVTSVEAVARAGDDRSAVLEALTYALGLRAPADRPLGPKNALGVQGYDLWIRCLETGDWRKAENLPGVHHNVACWHECRCYAERFLRLAGEKLGGDARPLFDEAGDHYRAVREALCEMQTIFVYQYPLPPVDAAGVKRAVQLLRAARAAEVKGLAVVERIVKRLTASAGKETKGNG